MKWFHFDSFILESLHEEFRQTQKREEILKELLTIVVGKFSKRDFEDLLDKISLSGSLNQGTYIASLFKENLKYKDTLINRDIDIDCQGIAKLDLEKPQDCLEDFKRKPGHF